MRVSPHLLRLLPFLRWPRPSARLLRGEAMPRRDERGRPLEDASFMVLFNRAHRACDFTIPAADADHPPMWYVPRPFSRILRARKVEAGETLQVPALSLVVLSTEKEKRFREEQFGV